MTQYPGALEAMNSRIRFHPRDDETLWDLGHGLAAVGPGWWPLVKHAFRRAEEMGAEIYDVRQKIAYLRISIDVRKEHGGREESSRLQEQYRLRSSRICEVCGGPAVPVEERIPRPTRTHCDDCHERYMELPDERSLWMERAGVWLPEWRRR